MDKKQAKERIEELRKKTEYYAQKYYDDDNPEITDFEYDMMMLELRTLESQNPEFITKVSLTQKVGGHVKEGFTKVEHEVPLQSLQDVFNFEEIEAFDERVKKVASDKGIDEVKVNGTIKYNAADEIQINLDVNGNMKLIDAVTNELIKYPFSFQIDEILEENDENLTKYFEKSQKNSVFLIGFIV